MSIFGLIEENMELPHTHLTVNIFLFVGLESPFKNIVLNFCFGPLSRYKLHGILCDDMGLGKTLQTICMLATGYFK